MPLLDVIHDTVHPVGDDPAWSESWYFNAYDPAADAGFVCRIGLKPHEHAAHGFLLTWNPGGGFSWIEERATLETMPSERIAIGGMSFEALEPGKRWRLSMRGRDGEGHELELGGTFEASMAPVGVDRSGSDFAQAKGASTGALASGHFEQSGRVVGTLVVDGAPTAIQARGIRDKSWGPRRTDGSRGLRGWRWFSIVMGNDFQLGGIRVFATEGELHRGWIRRGAEITTVRHFGVRTTLADDGFTHRGLVLEVTDKHGGTIRLDGEILRVATVGIGEDDGMTILEGLARFTGAGRQGYGIAEYAHLLGGDGRPVVAID